MHNLSGQHVLITGASGGVGTVAVRTFLEYGCQVTAQVNTNLDSLLSLARTSDRLQIVHCDVTSEQDVKELYEEIWTPIDILVLNHGYFRSENLPIADMSLSSWQKTIDINLTGSFLVARGFLRQVNSARETAPKICIIGSTAGKYGEADHADYASSKSALQYGFTLTLKNEIVKHHAQGRVNAVAPGWISTPMAEKSMDDPNIKYAALASTPLKKIATAQDVVNTVIFLCGDGAAHITGTCLMVEGGMEGRVLNSRADVGIEDP